MEREGETAPEQESEKQDSRPGGRESDLQDNRTATTIGKTTTDERETNLEHNRTALNNRHLVEHQQQSLQTR